MELGTKEKPVVVDKGNVAQILADTGKMLNKTPVPIEDRMAFNPKTGEFVTISKNKYPVTRPNLKLEEGGK